MSTTLALWPKSAASSPPGGQLIAMVPLIEGWAETYQDVTVSPGDRARHYGQWDHIRYYGADFRARIACAGFALEEYTADGPASARHALLRGEKVFKALK
jgi:hypothetical protein